MVPGLRTTAVCLISLIASLLLVGVVSGTLVGHLIQVIPAGLALTAVALRTKWATHLALPIFVFWIAIMILIWLWLLGIAAIVTGHFTPAEIVLTLIIGVPRWWDSSRRYVSPGRVGSQSAS